MCILSFLPAHAELDTDALWNGGISNPDGHGWAIADTRNGRMLIGKSLKLSEAIGSFQAARKATPGMPALFHSRWATHGSVTTANVHPFYVGGSELTVVGHNGILPAAAHPAKGDDRSDTRVFADEILPTRYRRLDKPRAFQALSQWAGWNKLVILTVDPRYRRNAYVVNETAGQWDGVSGIWHSNSDYLGLPKWLDTGSYTFSRRDPDTGAYVLGTREGSKSPDNECYICELGTVGASGICSECGTSADCLEHRSHCECYWPEVLRRDIEARSTAAHGGSSTAGQWDEIAGDLGESADDQDIIDAAGRMAADDVYRYIPD